MECVFGDIKNLPKRKHEDLTVGMLCWKDQSLVIDMTTTYYTHDA